MQAVRRELAFKVRHLDSQQCACWRQLVSYLQRDGNAVELCVERLVTDVGITKRELEVRGAGHGKDLERIAVGLSKNEARGTEQALIEHHGLGKNGVH
jgi:hypothetical protein